MARMTDLAPPVRFTLGLDLGLLTGVCLWDCKKAVPTYHGVIDVRRVEGELERLAEWRARLLDVLRWPGAVGYGPEAVAYEEVRHMQGQGARYILMEQGIVLAEAAQRNMLCAGVNVSTLKAYARRWGQEGVADKDLPAPLKTAEDMQLHLATCLVEPDRVYGPDDEIGEDEAMAAWVAVWLAEQVRG